MIIDCHVHLGRNEHIKADVKELLESMDSAKIDKAMVFAGDLNAYPTYEMLKEIEPHRDRLYGVAAWNFGHTTNITSPEYGVWALGTHQRDIYRKLHNAGLISAVKFYTGYDHYAPNSQQVRYALEELNKSKCPVIFHMGDCLSSVHCAKLKYAQPLDVDDVAVDYPDINFIIAHMGYPWVTDTAEVCYKNKNVYTDISGFVYGKFNKEDAGKFGQALYDFMDIADSSKLLFGTDWPISNQRSYIETLEYLSDISQTYKMSQILTPKYMTQNTKQAFNLNV